MMGLFVQLTPQLFVTGKTKTRLAHLLVFPRDRMNGMAVGARDIAPFVHP
jgi:hypothetical protein